MKRIGFFVLCIVASCSIAFAQGKAEVSVDKAVHDYGTVAEEDGNIDCVFTVKNTGNAPLVISRVTASCGCTTPDWTKSPIAPGATGVVNVTYGTKGRPGPFSKTISLYTNADTKAKTLTIKGNVTPKAQNPETTYPISMGDLRLKRESVSFNNIKDTETRTMIIETFNNGSAPMRLTFDNVPKHIAVSASPSTLDSKKSGKITVTFKAKDLKAYGVFNENIGVAINSVKNNNTISVSSTVIPDFSKMSANERENAPVLSIEPASLVFNDVKKDKSMNLEITNNGKTNLIIYGLQTVTPDMIELPSGMKEIKPGKTQKFKVSINAANVKTNTSGYINVVCNDPKAPIKAVRTIISVPAK